jgi:hypothetical protein
MDFWSAYVAKMLLPIICFVIVSILYLVQETIASNRQFRYRKTQARTRNDMLTRARDLESVRHRSYFGVVNVYFREAFFPTLSVVVFTLFTYITSSAVSPLSCVRHNNQYLMYRNPSQDCYTADWYSHLPVVVVFIFMYAVCIPLAVVFVLVRHFKKEQHQESLRMFGSLVLPYKTQFFYWEVVCMLKKALFVVSTEFINSTQGFFVRSSSSILAVALFGGLEALWQPYITFNSNLLSCRYE